MRHHRFSLGSLLVGILLGCSYAAQAVVFTPGNTLRDNRDSTALGFGVIDAIQVFFRVQDVAGPGGSFVPGLAPTFSARNTFTGEIFGPGFIRDCNQPLAFNCYFGLASYSVDRAKGAWEIFQGAPAPILTMPAYDPLAGATGTPGSDALPFAQNIQILENDLTPKFGWDLPQEVVDHLLFLSTGGLAGALLNNGNVDRWRVRVNERNPDGSVGFELYDTNNAFYGPTIFLPLDTTMFELPAIAALAGPDEYVVQIMLEGLRDPVNPFFTRARVRVPFQVAAVPEPGTAVLLGLGLAALGFACGRRTTR